MDKTFFKTKALLLRQKADEYGRKESPKQRTLSCSLLRVNPQTMVGCKLRITNVDYSK